MVSFWQVGKHFLLAIATFFILSTTSGQEKVTKKSYTTTSPKAIALYEKAIQLYFQKQYRQAIETLQKTNKVDKKFVEVYLQLATIYRELDDFEQAANQLQLAQRQLPIGKMPYLYYEIAQLYYRSGFYAKAKSIADGIILTDQTSALLLPKLQALQQNLLFALEQVRNPHEFKPRKLPPPLNQFISQYFPILTVDQETILFTALDNDYKENIYISYKDSLNQWSPPISISNQINQPTGNEGTCTISADKKTLIFTACSQEQNHGICDLYISHKIGESWSVPQNLGPQVNSGIWQSQPSLSADGKTLYFVSERTGNYGRNDIWKTTLQDNNEWAEPINLGPTINSKGREVSPFIHPNGQTLFFASDRTPSMGGFDIYYANYVDGKWTNPVNLGYPINDHKDQVSIFITADGKKGYYAEGKRKDFNYQSSHLYEFDMPTDLIEMPKSNLLKIKIIDAENQARLQAYATVYNITTDSLQQRLVTGLDGEINLIINEGQQYLLSINKEGYIFENKKITYEQTTHSSFITIDTITLKPLKLYEYKILEYVYFDYDDYQLNAASSLELTQLVNLLKNHPTICIELEGHTDSHGSDSYNQILSTQRAKTIYDFLIQAGIDANRLTYKGYGKTRPLVANDSPEYQHLNRRVAFKITNL